VERVHCSYTATLKCCCRLNVLAEYPRFLPDVTFSAIIRSGYDELLGRYLESKGLLPLMYFYQSATRFQEARFNHDVERLSECTMLFERYVSRNAEDKITLPEPIRRDIVRQLLRGRQTIYAVAAKWALLSICADHWACFKSEVNAAITEEDRQEVSRLAGQVFTTMGSVQFTSLDDGSVTLAAAPAGAAAEHTGTSENSLNSAPASLPNAAAAAPTKQANTGPGSPTKLPNSAAPSHRPRPAPLSFHDSDDLDAVTTLATRAARAFPNAVTSPCASRREVALVLPTTPGSPASPLLWPVPLPLSCDATPRAAQSSRTAANSVCGDVEHYDRCSHAAAGLGGLKLNLTVNVALAPASSTSHTAASVCTPHPTAGTHARTPFHKISVPPKRPVAHLQPLAIPEGSVSLRSDHAPTPSVRSMRESFHSQLVRLSGAGANPSSSMYDLVTSGCGRLRKQTKSATEAAVPSARTVLEHAQCCSVFKEFLDREGLSQTVLFCIEVEEFRRIPSFDFQLVRARKIYSKYMHELAAMPVPVTTFTRNEILRCITGGVVLPTLFKCAAEEVVRYMEIFQFPRFLQAPDMQRVAAILKSESQHPTRLLRRSSLSVHAMPQTDAMNLKSILKNQSCTRYLKDYCAKMYCTENLLFWLDVDNYKNLPGSDYMRRVACKIYKKYVADGAKMQVNVSYSVKQDIFAHLLDGDRQLFKKVRLNSFWVFVTLLLRFYECARNKRVQSRNVF
jgi:hypothetical protein